MEPMDYLVHPGPRHAHAHYDPVHNLDSEPWPPSNPPEHRPSEPMPNVVYHRHGIPAVQPALVGSVRDPIYAQNDGPGGWNDYHAVATPRQHVPNDVADDDENNDGSPDSGRPASHRETSDRSNTERPSTGNLGLFDLNNGRTPFASTENTSSHRAQRGNVPTPTATIPPTPPSVPRRMHARVRRAPSSRQAQPVRDEEVERGRRAFLEQIMNESLRASHADPADIEIAERSILEESNAIRSAQVMRGAVSSMRRVASKATHDSLQKVETDELPENERTCVICYNDFGVETPEGIKESPLRLPKCKHVFGDHCIKKWFEDSDNCPYCRDKLHSEPKYATGSRTFFHLMRTRNLSGNASPLEVNEEALRGHYMRAEGSLVQARAYAQAQTLALAQARPPSGERRSPPDDTNEPQRRTRPRHNDSALHGSTPSWLLADHQPPPPPPLSAPDSHPVIAHFRQTTEQRWLPEQMRPSTRHSVPADASRTVTQHATNEAPEQIQDARAHSPGLAALFPYGNPAVVNPLMNYGFPTDGRSAIQSSSPRLRRDGSARPNPVPTEESLGHRNGEW